MAKRSTPAKQERPAPPEAAACCLNQDPQLVQDFLVEAREHLGQIEARLLEIEQGSVAGETLHSAFRSVHSIKGLAGFLDYAVIQRVAHEVETLLDQARNGDLPMTPTVIDVVLSAGDYIGGWLRVIERRQNGVASSDPPSPDGLLERIRRAGAPEPAVHTALEAVPPACPDHELPARSESSLVKVNTAKLEYLVDMVGELVIAQSLLRHNPDLASVRTPRVQRDIAQLGRVTAEVQKTAMAMRMVPVGQLFRRMTRLVRDLCRKSGKLATLELAGEDVELDRTIVEELADPLVHMIRNSMDHGVESPEERESAGKPRQGNLRLSARHEAGHIIISLTDDGRGLNRERILAKAVTRGLAGGDAALADSEVFGLIFQPGFSTAETVTDVSGRGVGMDVVRKHVEKLRGRIDIESEWGRGATFHLKVPLTLAIIEGLVVQVGTDRYIVPVFAVREILKPSPEMIFTVEGKGTMALVRDRLLPVLRLGERLGVVAHSPASGAGLLIVSETEGRTFCLLVDGLAGKQEVVIKSLGPAFNRVRGIAGGAVLGDGRVGLILDLAGLWPREPLRAPVAEDAHAA